MLYFVRSKEVEHEPFSRQRSRKGLKVYHLLGSIRGGISPRSLYPLYMLSGGGFRRAPLERGLLRKKGGASQNYLVKVSRLLQNATGIESPQKPFNELR